MAKQFETQTPAINGAVATHRVRVAPLVTMQLVGGMVARFGSARVIRVTLAALPFSLYGIALADTPWLRGRSSRNPCHPHPGSLILTQGALR